VPNRKWDARTKAMIVISGLKGKPIAEICNEYQIAHYQYYRWRDQFLANIQQVFDGKGSRREKALLRENSCLKKIIGDLTIELKKSESEW